MHRAKLLAMRGLRASCSSTAQHIAPHGPARGVSHPEPLHALEVHILGGTVKGWCSEGVVGPRLMLCMVRCLISVSLARRRQHITRSRLCNLSGAPMYTTDQNECMSPGYP